MFHEHLFFTSHITSNDQEAEEELVRSTSCRTCFGHCFRCILVCSCRLHGNGIHQIRHFLSGIFPYQSLEALLERERARWPVWQYLIRRVSRYAVMIQPYYVVRFIRILHTADCDHRPNVSHNLNFALSSPVVTHCEGDRARS